MLGVLEKGVCRPSSSPWALPAVAVKKPDNSVRPRFGARKLNDTTKKDSCLYLASRTGFASSNSSAGRSSSLRETPRSSGYWQVPLPPDSVPKAAFAARWGLYEFLVVPFGLWL